MTDEVYSFKALCTNTRNLRVARPRRSFSGHAAPGKFDFSGDFLHLSRHVASSERACMGTMSTVSDHTQLTCETVRRHMTAAHRRAPAQRRLLNADYS